MTSSSTRAPLVALTAAALLCGGTAAPAAAAPPPTAAAGVGHGRLAAVVDQPLLAPGGSTRIVVSPGTDDGGTSGSPTGVTFRTPRQDVVRVGRDGTVTALRPGTAVVEVRHRRARTTVTVQVARRGLTSEPARSSPSCTCDVRVLGGFGFTPGTEISVTTDGTPGVHVSGAATADATGAFAGEVDPWSGDVLSGVAWVVEWPTWDPDHQCAPGTPYTLTATDGAGLTAELHAVC